MKIHEKTGAQAIQQTNQTHYGGGTKQQRSNKMYKFI